MPAIGWIVISLLSITQILLVYFAIKMWKRQHNKKE